MRKLVLGMLIVGGVIVAIAVIVRRRSGSAVDDWDSLAADSYSQASQSASRVADAARDSMSKVTDAAKGSVSKVADAAKDSVSKATDAAKNA